MKEVLGWLIALRENLAFAVAHHQIPYPAEGVVVKKGIELGERSVGSPFEDKEVKRKLGRLPKVVKVFFARGLRLTVSPVHP